MTETYLGERTLAIVIRWPVEIVCAQQRPGYSAKYACEVTTIAWEVGRQRDSPARAAARLDMMMKTNVAEQSRLLELSGRREFHAAVRQIESG